METSETVIRNRVREVRSKFKDVNDLYLVLDEIDKIHDSILAKGEVEPSDQRMYTRITGDFVELTNFAKVQFESEKSKVNQEIAKKKERLDNVKKEYSFEEEKLQVRNLIDEDFDAKRLDQSRRELKQKFSEITVVEGEIKPHEERLSELDRQLSHLSMIRPQPLDIEATPSIEQYVSAVSDCTREGEYLKVGVKVMNQSNSVIIGTRVEIEAPEGLEYIDPTSPFIILGNIEPKGGFQSAIFKLKPKRCVSGKVIGSAAYRDHKNIKHTIDVNPVEVASVCPFLTNAGSRKDEVLSLIKDGVLATQRNAYSFKGTKPSTVFEHAQNCVRLLDLEEKKVDLSPDGIWSGYAFYVGQIKPRFAFAVQIQVVGREDSGQLIVYVYSDQEAAITGFFKDVVQDMQAAVKIFEEKLSLAVDKCPSCGAVLDLTQKTAEGLVSCKYCRKPIYLPKAA